MSPVYNQESVGLQYNSVYNYSGGMVTNYNFTLLNPTQSILILNGDLYNDGSIITRRGKTKINQTPFSGNTTILSLASIPQTNPSAPDLLLAGAGSTLSDVNTTTGTITDLRTGLSPGFYLSSAALENFLFYCNGVDTPFITDGTVGGTYQMGITPVDAVQLAGLTVNPVNGTLLIPAQENNGTDGPHRVTFRYRSTITGAQSNPYVVGDIVQSTTVVIANPLSTYEVIVGAAMVSSDPQVDTIDYFVQESGVADDAPYYYLGSSPNIAGTYDFGNAVSDVELTIKEILDVDNDLPPASIRNIEINNGRAYAIKDDFHIIYSKIKTTNTGIVFLPTSWPVDNEIEVGFGDGDPLVKLVNVNGYILAFKRKSIWILINDPDSGQFEYRRLQTNYTNVGLLNQRSVVQANNRVFFVSDDLKFHYFYITDFSRTELRLKDPPPSDAIADLFTEFASAYRNQVNLVNYTFAQFSQVWVSFSNGADAPNPNNNFSTFVFDYSLNNGEGGWAVHTGLEIASSCLIKDNASNYRVFTGDYYGYVWKHGDTTGDGALINSTSTGGNGATSLFDTTQTFTSDLVGTFVTIIDANGNDQTRRIIAVPGSTEITVNPAWTTIPGTEPYTIGGINFQVWTRDDWCEQDAPVDFDKYGWYIDFDINIYGNYTYQVQVVIDRTGTPQTLTVRDGDFTGSSWGFSRWGAARWSDSGNHNSQVGLDFLFKQCSIRIINKGAGQPLKINGHTYCFQNLNKVRKS